MRVLGIETTAEFCGFAVADDDTVLGRVVSDVPGKHVEQAAVMIGGLLENVSMGLGDLNGIAVSLGPGSFTGLRIGLGTAKGLGLGTGLPLVGVPTLDCIAEALLPWAGYIVPLRDARRGEIYMSSYRSDGGVLEQITDYRALIPGRVAEEIVGLVGKAPTLVAGDALGPYGDFLREHLPKGVVFAPQELWAADPAMVARIGSRKLLRGKSLDLEASEPLYLRPSEAERAARGLTGDRSSSD
jgi:tRNA threonylcarbamoyladenosine biosynthesis protein TsaB